MKDKKIIEFDGHTAFPCVAHNGDRYAGMLLKDYFASKAMVGLLSCTINQTIDGIKTDKSSSTVAKISYDIAEAMMNERFNRYKS